MEQSSRNGIQVIARAAAVLRALKGDGSGQSLGQIAETVGLPRSTVQRIVRALQGERLIIADASGGRLRLGPEVSALAQSTYNSIVETCRLLLVELTQQTGETADLSVMRGSVMVFLDQVPGLHRLRTVSSVGEVFPLTTTANGLACLAQLDPTKARALILAEWERRGVSGDMVTFQTGLDRIRKTGLALDIDQHTSGICAIGFAFRDAAGDLHAISVPVPSTRFPEVRGKVETALRRTAAHVHRTLFPKG